MKDSTFYHAVRYDHFGHRDVLHIDELPLSSPKAREELDKRRTNGKIIQVISAS